MPKILKSITLSLLPLCFLACQLQEMESPRTESPPADAPATSDEEVVEDATVKGPAPEGPETLTPTVDQLDRENAGLFPYAPLLRMPEAPRLPDFDEAAIEWETIRVHPEGANGRLRSVQAAVQEAKNKLSQGTSVRILLAPGTYRETVDIVDATSGAWLLIEGEDPERTIISGSDLFTRWTPRRGHRGQYEHPWALKFGYQANPWPGLMPMTTDGFRRELMFVDGRPQVQVDRVEDLRDGSYFVDEESERIIFQPHPSVVLSRADIEVSVRPEPMNGAHSKLLRIWKSDRIILRGLRFEHGSVGAFVGAVQILGSSHILIENCSMNWNAGAGLLIDHHGGRLSQFMVLRDVETNYNGFMGLTGGFHDTLLERHTANYNNWRGMQYGATGWAPCGWKLSHLRRVHMIDCEASGNGASGGWFDDIIEDVLLDGFVAVGNYRSGLSVEATEGPGGFGPDIPGALVVRRAQLAENSTGMNLFDSRNVALVDSIVINNTRSQIRLSGSTVLTEEALAEFEQSWRRRRLSSRQVPTHISIHDTIIGVTKPDLDARFFRLGMREQAFIASDGSYRLQALVDTLSLSGLSYLHPDSEGGAVFSNLKDEPLAFTGWQALVGEDYEFSWNSAEALEAAARVKSGVRHPGGFGQVRETDRSNVRSDELEL